MNASSGAADAVARQQRFELRMTLTEKDFAQFMRRIQPLPIERVLSILPSVLLGIVSGLIGIIGWEWLARQHPSVWIASGAFLAFILMFAVLLLLWRAVVVRSYLRGIFRGQPIGMGEVLFVADEENIVTDSAGVMTRVPWTLINRIVETDRYIFLMYGRLTGVIVPMSAFPLPDHAKRFAAFVRSKAVAPR